MTTNITNLLDEVVTISHTILEEADSEHPSLDDIDTLFQKRRCMIDELGLLSQRVDFTLFNSEEQEKLSLGFRAFRKLHADIQPSLERHLKKKEELLDEATKKRKAEDQYHLLEKPDISYLL